MGIECYILCWFFLFVDDDFCVDDGLRGYVVCVGVFFGLIVIILKVFEKSYFLYIEVVFVFIKNDQGVDCL